MRQVRARRLRADRTVEDLAAHAEVAAKTVQNLERGRWSTLATLVRVLRAPDAEDWLHTLTSDEPVSPIAVLAVTHAQRPARQRAGRQRAGRQRASRSDA